MAEGTATPVAEKTPFEIFGSADLNDKGQIKSTYPSWYYDHLKESLKNDIDQIQTQLKFDRVPKSEIQLTRERLKQKEQKLLDIESSAMSLRGKNKDRVYGIYRSLGEKIGEAMPSRDDMRRGLADAHEEVKRMTEPCIELRGDELVFAKAANVRIVKGKVTRDGAAKAWKLAGKSISERTNTEFLRRD